MDRRGEESDDREERGGGQDRQTEIIDILVPVMTDDGWKGIGRIKSMKDLVVGNLEVDRLAKIVCRVGWLLSRVCRIGRFTTLRHGRRMNRCIREWLGLGFLY